MSIKNSTDDELRALLEEARQIGQEVIAQCQEISNERIACEKQRDSERFARLSQSPEETISNLYSDNHEDINLALILLANYWSVRYAKLTLHRCIDLANSNIDYISIYSLEVIQISCSRSRDREMTNRLLLIARDPNRSNSVRCAAYCAACDINDISTEHWLLIVTTKNPDLFNYKLFF